eukprot:CFRG6467T1
MDLFNAIENQDVELVHILLESSSPTDINWANPEKKKWTALHIAAYFGDVGIVSELISHGADLTARSQNGSRPLHLASTLGKLEVVAKLLEHGVDVDKVDRTKSTALHKAVDKGELEVAELLVGFGANPTAANRKGETPVSIAEGKHNNAMLRVLKRENTYNVHTGVDDSSAVLEPEPQTMDNVTLSNTQDNPNDPEQVIEGMTSKFQDTVIEDTAATKQESKFGDGGGWEDEAFGEIQVPDANMYTHPQLCTYSKTESGEKASTLNAHETESSHMHEREQKPVLEIKHEEIYDEMQVGVDEHADHSGLMHAPQSDLYVGGMNNNGGWEDSQSGWGDESFDEHILGCASVPEIEQVLTVNEHETVPPYGQGHEHGNVDTRSVSDEHNERKLALSKDAIARADIDTHRHAQIHEDSLAQNINTDAKSEQLCDNDSFRREASVNDHSSHIHATVEDDDDNGWDRSSFGDGESVSGYEVPETPVVPARERRTIVPETPLHLLPGHECSERVEQLVNLNGHGNCTENSTDNNAGDHMHTPTYPHTIAQSPNEGCRKEVHVGKNDDPKTVYANTLNLHDEQIYIDGAVHTDNSTHGMQVGLGSGSGEDDWEEVEQQEHTDIDVNMNYLRTADVNADSLAQQLAQRDEVILGQKEQIYTLERKNTHVQMEFDSRVAELENALVKAIQTCSEKERELNETNAICTQLKTRIENIEFNIEDHALSEIERDELLDQLQAKEREIDNGREREEALEVSVRENSNQITAFQEEIEVLHHSLNEREHAIQLAEERLDEGQRAHEELICTIDELTAEAVTLRERDDKCRTSEGEAELIMRQLQEVNADMRNKDADIARLEIESQDYAERLTASKQQVQKLAQNEEMLIDYQAKVSMLEAELEERNELLLIVDEQLSNAESAKEDIEVELVERTAQVEDLKAEYRDLSMTIEQGAQGSSKEAEIEALVGALEQREALVLQLKDNIETLTQARNADHQQIQELSTALDEKEHELMTLRHRDIVQPDTDIGTQIRVDDMYTQTQARLKNMEADIEALSTALDEKEHELVSLRERETMYVQKEARVQVMDAEIEEASSIAPDEKEHEVVSLRERETSETPTEAHAQELQTDIEALSIALDEKEHELASLRERETMYEQTQERVQEMETEIEVLSTALDEKEHELVSLREKEFTYTQTEARMQDTEADVEALSTALEEKEHELVSLREKETLYAQTEARVQEMEADIEALSTALNEKEHEFVLLREKETSEMPTEAPAQDMQTDIEALSIALDEKEHELVSLREKESTYTQTEARMQDMEADVEALSTALSEKEHEVVSLREKESTYMQTEARVQDMEADVEALSTALDEKEHELVSLRERETLYEQTQVRVQEMEAEIEELSTALNETEHELILLREKETMHAQTEARVQEMEDDIEALSTAMDEKEKEIVKLQDSVCLRTDANTCMHDVEVDIKKLSLALDQKTRALKSAETEAELLSLALEEKTQELAAFGESVVRNDTEQEIFKARLTGMEGEARLIKDERDLLTNVRMQTHGRSDAINVGYYVRAERDALLVQCEKVYALLQESKVLPAHAEDRTELLAQLSETRKLLVKASGPLKAICGDHGDTLDSKQQLLENEPGVPAATEVTRSRSIISIGNDSDADDNERRLCDALFKDSAGIAQLQGLVSPQAQDQDTVRVHGLVNNLETEHYLREERDRALDAIAQKELELVTAHERVSDLEKAAFQQQEKIVDLENQIFPQHEGVEVRTRSKHTEDSFKDSDNINRDGDGWGNEDLSFEDMDDAETGASVKGSDEEVPSEVEDSPTHPKTVRRLTEYEQDLAEAHTRVKNLECSKKELEERLILMSGYERDLANAHAKEDALSCEIDKLKNDRERLDEILVETEKRARKETVSKTYSDKQDLSMELAIANETIMDLEIQLENAHSQIEGVSQAQPQDASVQKLIHLRSQVADLQSHVDAQRDREHEFEDRCESLLVELSVAREKIESLEKELEDVSRATAVRKLPLPETPLPTLPPALEEAAFTNPDSMMSSAPSYAAPNLERADLEHQIKLLTVDLEGCKNTIEQLEHSVVESEIKLSEACGTKDTMVAKVLELETELDGCRQKIDNLRIACEHTERELTKESSAKGKLMTELSERERELNDLRSNMNEQEKQKLVNEETERLLRAEISARADEEETLMHEIEQLQSADANYKARIATDTEHKNEELPSNPTILKPTCDGWDEDDDHTKYRVQNLEHVLMEKELEIKGLAQSNTEALLEAEQRVLDAEDMLENKEEELERAREQIGELEDELEQAREHVQRSSGDGTVDANGVNHTSGDETTNAGNSHTEVVGGLHRTDEMTKLEEDFNSERARRSMLESANIAAVNDLNLTNIRVHELEAELNDLSASAKINGDLQSILDGVRSELQNANQRVLDLEFELENAKQQLAEASERESDIQLNHLRELGHRDNEKLDWNQREEAVSQQLHDASASLEKMKEQVAQMQEKADYKARAVTDVNEIECEKVNKERALVEAQEKLQHMENELRVTQNELRVTEEEVTSLNGMLDETTAELEETAKRVTVLESFVAHKEPIVTANEENAEQIEQLEMVRARVLELEQAIVEYEEEIDVLQKDIADRVLKSGELQNRLMELECAREMRCQESAAVHTEKQIEFKAELDKSKTKCIELQAELDEQKALVNLLKDRFDPDNAQATMYEDDHTNNLRENLSMNVAVTPATGMTTAAGLFGSDSGSSLISSANNSIQLDTRSIFGAPGQAAHTPTNTNARSGVFSNPPNTSASTLFNMQSSTSVYTSTTTNTDEVQSKETESQLLAVAEKEQALLDAMSRIADLEGELNAYKAISRNTNEVHSKEIESQLLVLAEKEQASLDAMARIGCLEEELNVYKTMYSTRETESQLLEKEQALLDAMSRIAYLEEELNAYKAANRNTNEVHAKETESQLSVLTEKEQALLDAIARIGYLEEELNANKAMNRNTDEVQSKETESQLLVLAEKEQASVDAMARIDYLEKEMDACKAMNSTRETELRSLRHKAEVYEKQLMIAQERIIELESMCKESAIENSNSQDDEDFTPTNKNDQDTDGLISALENAHTRIKKCEDELDEYEQLVEDMAKPTAANDVDVNGRKKKVLMGAYKDVCRQLDGALERMAELEEELADAEQRAALMSSTDSAKAETDRCFKTLEEMLEQKTRELEMFQQHQHISEKQVYEDDNIDDVRRQLNDAQQKICELEEAKGFQQFHSNSNFEMQANIISDLLSLFPKPPE